MKRVCGAWVLLVALGAPGALAGDTLPAAPSPELKNALNDLAAPEFAKREAAAAAAERILASHLEAIMETPGVPKERVITLLEFDEGLTRWALEMLKAPAEERQDLLAWGLHKDNVAITSKLYSATSARRTEGIKALAASKDSQATTLLARLLDDESREVRLAAMEAVWDRPATEAVVEALWKISVTTLWNNYFPRPDARQARMLVNNGLGMMPAANPFRRAADAEPATDTLINLKSPLVAARLRKHFQEMAKDILSKDLQYNMMSVFQTEPGKQLGRLLEAYHKDVPEALPVVLRLASMPKQYGNQQKFANNSFYMSNRTAAVAMLVIIAGQDPKEYKLKKMNQLGYGWVFESESDENAAITRVQKVLAEKKSGGGKTSPDTAATVTTKPAETGPATGPATTAPTTTGPAETAPAAVPQIRAVPGVIQLQGTIRINGGGAVDVQIDNERVILKEN